MAFLLILKLWFTTAALFSTAAFGFSEQDPAQIAAKALLCFNSRMIYSSCQEEYQLNESGNINVPPKATDEYCGGPCLDETKLVLNCVDSILSNFIFYNKATIQDVRSTLNAGCSYTSERGKFNVAEHIQGEYSPADPLLVTNMWMYALALLFSAFLI